MTLRIETLWIETLMTSLGYLGITFLMALENLIPPIPSELIMPLAGFTAARGELNLPLVIAAGTLGCVLGSLPLYALGAVLGQERLERWTDKYGRWLGVKRQDIQRACAWFGLHGNKAVFFLRLVPGVRSLISIPAGMVRMPLPTFLLYTLLGSALWTTLLTLAGYLLGENYERVDQYLSPLSYVVIGMLFIFTVNWLLKRRSRA
jgi:membrane protein DedA with SNARE-associated domain